MAKKIFYTLFILFIIINKIKAQQQPLILTINQVIQYALERNANLQGSALEINYHNTLKKTFLELPKTDFDFQYGNINSGAIDYSFQITQNFSLPNVYAAKKRLLNSQWSAAEKKYLVQKTELTKNLKLTIYQLLFLEEKHKILLKQDSIYEKLAHMAAIKHQTGESSKLEQISAEVYRQEIKHLLTTNTKDILVQYNELKKQLQTQDSIQIQGNLIDNALAIMDTSISQNPTLLYWQELQQIANAQIRVEKSRFTPDLRLGYFNMSIDKKSGFQTLQAGLSIPIWHRTINSSTQAAKIWQEIYKTQLENTKWLIQKEYESILIELKDCLNWLNYYQKYALPQALLLSQSAEKSYKAGEISYIAFTQHMQQSWQIQLKYLENWLLYQKTITQLAFLLGKN